MADKINDLIFKELIRSGYSLQGHTRIWNIANSKLWYLTPKQAQAYLDLEESKDYGKRIFMKEIKMLKKFMPEIAEQILHGSALNLIDIGCGDGKKAITPIQILSSKTKVRYCPIDISSFMVSKAIKEISKRKLSNGGIVNFRWNISDFDNLENVASLLRDAEYRQNLFLFLGDTLSNFEAHEVLYELVEAMDEGEDYLLIGVTLNSVNPNELVKPYKAKMVDDFLSLILTQIGFNRDELEFDVRFANSRVEIFYTLKNSKALDLSGKKIYFDKGDQILVGISYRYTAEQLEEFMKIYFNNFKFYFNEDKTRTLILCEK